MEDERNQPLPSPRGFRFKFWKIMTLTFLILVGLSAVSFAGIKTTSTSKFCSSCHEMKPEYYTWKASTHSEVECDSCHIAPGGENLVKEKMGLVEEVYRSVTNTYTAPIQMPTEIPNSACGKCHNMSTRTVSPSGDLIIPHDKHLNKNISCTQCHSSVAHGKVTKRLLTFQADYSKWNEKLGHSAMSDIEFTTPQMEECMDCHRARKVSIECATCHSSTMYPDSHKKVGFASGNHAQLAEKDIQECDLCHKYMSEKKITLFQTEAASASYLIGKSSSNKEVTVKDYSRTNSYCRDCHSQKPGSHDTNFFSQHGKEASGNEERCLTCHDYQPRNSEQLITNTTCSTCHNKSHGSYNVPNHSLRNASLSNPTIRKECYSCHVESTCTKCHRNS